MSLFNSFADQLPAFSEMDLLAAYRRAEDQPDSPETAALLAELKRRGLDA